MTTRSVQPPVPATRLAVLVERYGPPEVLALVEVAVPRVGPHELLIRTAAIAVNFADVQRRRGPYPGGVSPPFIPGSEAAGTVIARGSRVRSIRVGARVVAFAKGGSYSTLVVADSSQTYVLPESLPFDLAGSCLVVGATSYRVLRSVARLQRGESVLVLAAAGGVGSFAVQLAKLMKAALVIGAVESDAKAALSREMGADAIVNYRASALANSVLQITEGKGADVIIDSVGADTLHESIKALAPSGRIVLMGQASGPAPNIPASQLFSNNQALLGYNGGLDRTKHHLAYRRDTTRVLQMLAADALQVHIFGRFPLADAAEAHSLLENQASMGKLVLQP